MAVWNRSVLSMGPYLDQSSFDITLWKAPQHTLNSLLGGKAGENLVHIPLTDIFLVIRCCLESL